MVWLDVVGRLPATHASVASHPNAEARCRHLQLSCGGRKSGRWCAAATAQRNGPVIIVVAARQLDTAGRHVEAGRPAALWYRRTRHVQHIPPSVYCLLPTCPLVIGPRSKGATDRSAQYRGVARQCRTGRKNSCAIASWAVGRSWWSYCRQRSRRSRASGETRLSFCSCLNCIHGLALGRT